MSRRKLPAENTPFFMVDPDPNDFFTIHPSEHTAPRHIRTSTDVEDVMVEILVLDHPEADEEARLLVRRYLKRGGKGWRCVLAERLMEYLDEPPSRWLLEEVAKQFAAEYGPKVAAVWRRERRRDRRRENRAEHDNKMIDELAKDLKAQGIRNYRLEAKKRWAEMQNVTIHALKQRRSRDPSRGTRQRRSKI